MAANVRFAISFVKGLTAGRESVREKGRRHVH